MRRARIISIVATLATSFAISSTTTHARANDCAVLPCDPSPPPEPRAEEQPADSTPQASPTRGRIEAGAAYKRLYDIPFYGADATLGIGGVYAQSAIFVELGAFAGRSENGLSTTQLRFAISPEVRLDRVTLGMELRLSFLSIRRATAGSAFENAGAGIRPYVGVDVVQWEDGRALVASAGLDADIYASVMWGPSLRVGARF